MARTTSVCEMTPTSSTVLFDEEPVDVGVEHPLGGLGDVGVRRDGEGRLRHDLVDHDRFPPLAVFRLRHQDVGRRNDADHATPAVHHRQR